MEAWAESALARALARGGRAAEVDRLELIAKPGGARVPRRDSALAETLLAAGEVDAAADQANRAAALADEAEAAHERVVALEVAARARLRQGRPDEALAAADEGLTVAEPKGYRPLVWRLRATRAGALTAQGRESEAAEERRKAASLVEELAAGIEDAGLRASYLAAAKKGA
jgi:ATP/maltotriose-dependent transcriptional regulator MalT